MSPLQTNYHTHSLYCDGKEPLSAFVSAAKKLNYQQLGFSSHAPVPFENDFGIHEEEINAYCQEIDQLQTQTNIQLLKALECDFIPGMTKSFEYYKETYHLDYIIGGVHLVRPQNSDQIWFIDGSDRQVYDDGLHELFDNNIKRAVTTFWEQTFEMIETEKMDIIAHFDKIKMHNQDRFFTEDERWYQILAEKALQLIKSHDIIIEVNTRGLYKKRCNAFYPATPLLMAARKMDIPVVISSDAHKSDDLGQFCPEAWSELQHCGYSHTVHFDKARGIWV